MSYITLPPKYYLAHFEELTSMLKRHYQHCLEREHVDFLTFFESLSEDAQCLYLRMANRKRRFFSLDNLRYREIVHFEAAVKELKEFGFARPPVAGEWPSLLEELPKVSLLTIAQAYDLPVKKNATKQVLQALLTPLEFLGPYASSFLVQEKRAELHFLLFLYFGRPEENLSLYTLRDLGIRQAGKLRTEFKARFTSLEEAHSEYFYTCLAKETQTAQGLEKWPTPLTEKSRILREEALLDLTEKALDSGDSGKARFLLTFCEAHPGREKLVRLLYQEGEKEAAKLVLQKILEAPACDVEFLFAEDFLSRKYEGKKKSVLTELLQSARKISIDESYFRQPEAGVIAWLAEQDIHSYHVENYVWNGLFCLLFWEELFESSKSTMANEFERLPRELAEKTFLTTLELEVSEKLKLLRHKAKLLKFLLQKAAEKKETANGIFGWHDSLSHLLELLVTFAPSESLEAVLLHMAGDYYHRSSGFPDLMAIEKGGVKFYEVKAPGDSLKHHQLVQLQALQKAGFAVEVLQVEYICNPEQIYVVVDLETTGHLGPYHRITEIGAVKVKGNKVVERFQTLLNPERHISLEIQQLTGITNEMVKDAPKFRDVSAAFAEFVKDAIFVAHNVGFDYGFLQAEYSRLEEKFVRPYICTKAGMKKHFPGLDSYGLKNLCQHFSISLLNHHRALDDAEAAAQLLLLINQKRSEGQSAT